MLCQQVRTCRERKIGQPEGAGRAEGGSDEKYRKGKQQFRQVFCSQPPKIHLRGPPQPFSRQDQPRLGDPWQQQRSTGPHHNQPVHSLTLILPSYSYIPHYYTDTAGNKIISHLGLSSVMPNLCLLQISQPVLVIFLAEFSVGGYHS